MTANRNTTLLATMKLRRLQMTAMLHRVTLQHQCQRLIAGTAIELGEDSSINVKFDGTTIVLNPEGEIAVNFPQGEQLQDYIRRIDDLLPYPHGDVTNFALTVDGAGIASWQPVGTHYKCVSDDEIDSLFEEEEEENA